MANPHFDKLPSIKTALLTWGFRAIFPAWSFDQDFLCFACQEDKKSRSLCANTSRSTPGQQFTFDICREKGLTNFANIFSHCRIDIRNSESNLFLFLEMVNSHCEITGNFRGRKKLVLKSSTTKTKAFQATCFRLYNSCGC